MKQLLVFTAIVTFLAGSAVAQYLQTTSENAWTYASNPAQLCGNSDLSFDLETVSSDNFLDLIIGQNIPDGGGISLSYKSYQDYNNGSGSFSTSNGDFITDGVACPTVRLVNDVVFGKLRTVQPRKDLAVLRSNEIRLYYNTGNGMETTARQTLASGASAGFWGPFDSYDAYDDLVVTSGSQVKIYRNLNTGYLSTSPYTFSITATDLVLAQMNDNIFNSPTTNKFDLVSYAGTQLSIRINNNNNGFNSPQNVTMPSSINAIAVEDINNDNYNDIVVALSGQEVRLYLNNGSGTINSTPAWTITNSTITPPYLIPANTTIVVGDLGSPGDATRNDGWNDILVTGYEAYVALFANTGSGSYFSTTPVQGFFAGNSYTTTGNVLLADVQNNGGLSLMYEHGLGAIYLNKHVGNPAPAPPRNIAWSGAAGQHPTISWAASKERDINGYNIYKYVPDDAGWYWLKLNSSLLTSTSYTDATETLDGTPPGVHYRKYYVKTVDVALQESNPSVQVNVPLEGLDPAKGLVRADGTPTQFFLYANYPNPFNPSTTIEFDLPQDGIATLSVYDVVGRKVTDLASGFHYSGRYYTTWNADNHASGTYFARFSVRDEFGNTTFSKVNKLVLMK